MWHIATAQLSFAFACLGRSSKSNQPRQLLCIESNESDVRIKEIIWLSGSSMGLGLSLSVSFEGLVFIGGASSENRMFGERVFLCAVTSNVSLLFFGEESVDTIPSQESVGKKHLQQSKTTNTTLRTSKVRSKNKRRPKKVVLLSQ